MRAVKESQVWRKLGWVAMELLKEMLEEYWLR
jgi:hypothetical protein